MTLPNHTQFAQLPPTTRVPLRGDLFVAEDGSVQTITNVMKNNVGIADEYQVVYEYAGWPIRTLITQGENKKYTEVKEAASLLARTGGRGRGSGRSRNYQR